MFGPLLFACLSQNHRQNLWLIADGDPLMSPIPTPKLVLMTKTPRMGRVKTRLARDIGTVLAWHFYRTAVTKIVRDLGSDPRWQTLLAVAPFEGLSDRGFFPPHLIRVPQGQGDLGDRMGRLMTQLPAGPIVMIGGDCPGITPAHIAEAFSALGRADAVFGPAHDGGYWLVGLKRRPNVPNIFQNVRWSTQYTLADTLANCTRLKVETLQTRHDIDTGADLAGWNALLKTQAHP